MRCLLKACDCAFGRPFIFINLGLRVGQVAKTARNASEKRRETPTEHRHAARSRLARQRCHPSSPQNLRSAWHGLPRCIGAVCQAPAHQSASTVSIFNLARSPRALSRRPVSHSFRCLAVPSATAAILLLAQLVLFTGVGAVIPTIALYGKAMGLVDYQCRAVAPAVAALLAQPAGGFADIAQPAMLGGSADRGLDLGTAAANGLAPPLARPA